MPRQFHIKGLNAQSEIADVETGKSLEDFVSDVAERRVVALVDAATVTIDASTTDFAILASLSQTTLFDDPIGGAQRDGKQIAIRITSAEAQDVTFGASIRATAVPLPTTTQGGTERWLLEWNKGEQVWDFIAINPGA